jgi:hypothetical protein
MEKGDRVRVAGNIVDILVAMGYGNEDIGTISQLMRDHLTVKPHYPVDEVCSRIPEQLTALN